MERYNDCSNREENICRTQFEFNNFCQLLKGDFTTQLAIPERFAYKLKEKLPKNVTVKGPSGLAWNVELAASNDALFFKRGWEVFVKDHSLQENDILMFRFYEDWCFHVLIFNQDSLCEKEASYFMRKCDEHKEIPEPHQSSPPSRAGLNGKARKKSHKKKGIIAKSLKKKITDSDAKQVSMSKRSARDPVYVSHRRPVTKEEQDAVFQLAQTAATCGNFLVVMKPTHVYKRFYLSIPPGWAAEHFGRNNQDVILRYKGDHWHCRYNLTSRGSGGLASGWKNFAVQNNLEESDVCGFALGERINNIAVLDVTVFRVVEDVTPLTLATSTT